MNEIPIIGGKQETVRISAKEDVSLIVEKNAAEITPYIKLSQYFSAPIAKNEALGIVIFTSEGQEIARVSLVAETEIETQHNKNRFIKIKIKKDV